ARLRGDVAVGRDVGHDVVPLLALVTVGRGEVYVLNVSAQLVDLLLADEGCLAVVAGHSQFAFGLGEGDPEAAPGGKLAFRPPQLGHVATGVASDERVVVNGVGVHEGNLSQSAE